MMHRLIGLTVATLAVAAARGGAQAPPPATPATSDPAGPVRFVCGQDGPEDLVVVPGNRWLVATAYGPTGGLFLIDTRAASSVRLFPAATATEAFDRQAF